MLVGCYLHDCRTSSYDNVLDQVSCYHDLDENCPIVLAYHEVTVLVDEISDYNLTVGLLQSLEVTILTFG